MAADIEKFFAWRTSQGSGDKIGAYRYVDPITGDVIHGEQTASYGHPAKFILIGEALTATEKAPDFTGAAINGSSTVSQVDFDTTFTNLTSPSAGIGMLVWIESGTADNEIRKLVSSPGANQYAVNADFSAEPDAATYRLLIDCFRYNSLLIKPEFSGSGETCVIRAHFYGPPQDNVQPTPGKAAPVKYVTRQYTLTGTTDSTDLSSGTSTYHGEILSMGVHGAVGTQLEVVSISSGNVWLWVASV